jgi:hypothetical protein
MGERFLILEETADALDVIDPELAVQFRLVNGLPAPQREALPGSVDAPQLERSSPSVSHEIRMDVGARQIASDCSCGAWSSAVDWDDIDSLVIEIRGHLGSVQASSEDGIVATGSPSAATGVEKRVG